MSAEEENEDENEEDDANAEWIRDLTTDGAFDDLGSPIDLNIAVMTTKKLKPLIWCNYQVPPKKLKLTNTGKTVVLSAQWHETTAFLVGGPFPSRYVFSQVHFHWGPNDMDGSEHTVDGGRLPMELHAVHFKSDYLNQETAMRRPDGIAVVVYFFKSLDNPKMNGIVKTLPSVEEAHSSMRMVPWVMTNLLRPFAKDYFLYRGSIISGDYIHRVLWLLSRQPIGISLEQVAEFRNLKDKNFEPLARKPRVLQEIGNRRVYHVNPSGSMHASLVPIPRDDPPENSTNAADCCETEAIDEISTSG